MKKDKKRKGVPEINMTAMPDIIFMLLFFFMVSTVIKQESNTDELVLPNTITSEATERTNPKELQIFVFKDEAEAYQIGINKIIRPLGSVDSLLAKSINRMRRDQIFPDRAILKIDKSVNIAAVNKVKLALQKAEILKVAYVHQAAGMKTNE